MSAKTKIDLSDIQKELLEGVDVDNMPESIRHLTVTRPGVRTVGYGATKYEDLLVIQVLLPPGAVLRTIRIEIDQDDPNKGTISCDEDPYLLEGKKMVKKEWKKLNSTLACDIESLLSLEAEKKYAIEGTTPSCGRLIQDFCWPDGLESHLNPIDPFVIGFRPVFSPEGCSLFENKVVNLYTSKGKVVPASLLTAFFFVNKHNHIKNTAGKGLRLGEASDTESEGSVSPAKQRGFKRNRRSNGSVSSSRSNNNPAGAEENPSMVVDGE